MIDSIFPSICKQLLFSYFTVSLRFYTTSYFSKYRTYFFSSIKVVYWLSALYTPTVIKKKNEFFEMLNMMKKKQSKIILSDAVNH